MCLIAIHLLKPTSVRYCTDMTEAVLARLYTWRLSLVVVRVAMGSLWPTAKYTRPCGSSLSAKVMLANRVVSLMVAPAPT